MLVVQDQLQRRGVVCLRVKHGAEPTGPADEQTEPATALDAAAVDSANEVHIAIIKAERDRAGDGRVSVNLYSRDPSAVRRLVDGRLEQGQAVGCG
jgi:hypothetical protein